MGVSYHTYSLWCSGGALELHLIKSTTITLGYSDQVEITARKFNRNSLGEPGKVNEYERRSLLDIPVLCKEL